MFFEGLDHAFERGLDLNLRQVLASEAFQRWHQEENRLFRPGHSGKAARLLARSDPLPAAYLFNSRSERQTLERLKRLPEFRYDRRNRALLRFFGHQLVEFAKQGLSPELLALAARWKRANRSERIALCREVVSLLQYSEPGRTVMQSMFSQQAEYALPAQWLVTGRRNCIGTAQLLQAFCSVAGIRSFAVTPLITAGQLMVSGKAQLVTWMLQSLDGVQIPSAVRARKSLQKWLDGWQEQQAASNWLHVGLVFQIAEKEWALVDPYQRQFGIYPPEDTWFQRNIAVLEKYGKYCPGLMLLHHCPRSAQQAAEVIAGRPWQCYETAKKFLALLAQESFPDNASLLPAAVARDIFEFVSFDERLTQVPQFADDAVMDMLVVVTLLAQIAIVKVRRMHEEAAKTGKPGIAVLSEQQLARLVAEDIPALAMLAAAEGATSGYWKQAKENLLHPLVEIGLPEFTIAVATLAHLGYFLAPGELEPELTRHSSSQFRLQSYVAGLLRGKGGMNPDPRLLRAKELLAAWPNKMRTTCELLLRLGYEPAERRPRHVTTDACPS